jgi:hypothetical protein
MSLTSKVQMQNFIVYLRDGQTVRVKALKWAAGTRFGKDTVDFYTADESTPDKRVYLATDAIACILPSEIVESEVK